MPVVEESGIRLEYPLDGDSEGDEQNGVILRARVTPPHVNNHVWFLYRVDGGQWQRARGARELSTRSEERYAAQLDVSDARESVRYYAFVRRNSVVVPRGADLSSSADTAESRGWVAELRFVRVRPEASAESASHTASEVQPLPERAPEPLPPEPRPTSNNAVNAAQNGATRTERTQSAVQREAAIGSASNTIDVSRRLSTMASVLPDKKHQQAITSELVAAGGDWARAAAALKTKLSPPALERAALAHSLSAWTGDHVPLVKTLGAQREVKNLRDVALRYDVGSLARLLDPGDVPEEVPGETLDEKRKAFATTLHSKLFALETSAVLQRMAKDVQLPIADAGVRSGVAGFLESQPEFNIRTTSVYAALSKPDALKAVAPEHRAGVVEQLKILQRVQAISPVPEAVPALMKANLTSAFRVAEMPESGFLRMQGAVLGENVARQVHANAVDSQIRNEHALVTLRETLRGSGLAIVDGQQTRPERLAQMKVMAAEKSVPLDLETLFGDVDHCECEDCLSVYSPAAYFVEVLQFLRHNNFGPNPAKPSGPNPHIHPGIAGTPVEKLFRRRPDLGCLELTCDNTFTVLPYVDLVNEVMESFVVHLGEYEKDHNVPKQATLETFNVEGESSSELLAQPQHVNYDAYCILKSAVYPFTLPYHQPIDATRIFLGYLGTSRWQLLDTFRRRREPSSGAALTESEQSERDALHQLVTERAVDAEYLGLTQEEYIILTREAFWPKAYFDLTQKKTFAEADYRQNIGVRPVHESYGYANEADMLSLDESARMGLTFVKQQFLRRTGLQYSDLVELLKTRFINPCFPQGQALILLESIRFSYRFLQGFLETSREPALRFGKLIAFLEAQQSLLPLLDAALHPDPCKPRLEDECAQTRELEQWVYCHFDRIGKLIVLEAGEGPLLTIEGVLKSETGAIVGYLRQSGAVLDVDGAAIGQVSITLGRFKKPEGGESARALLADGSPVGYVGSLDAASLEEGAVLSVATPVVWRDRSLNDRTFRIEAAGTVVGQIRHDGQLQNGHEDLLFWRPARDTCNLDKVRLVHLDGTPVGIEEYDCIQRFIRLWRRLGWSIDETDKALVGLAWVSSGASSDTAGSVPSPQASVAVGASSSSVGFDAFVDDCAPKGGVASGCGELSHNGKGLWDSCGERCAADCAISPEFLHQLRAVRELVDRTGLPLPRLLAFWADISTAGEKSLYSKLFLTHNLRGIDKVFDADASGGYLTTATKITDHLPVLMAALKLKADDIVAIMSFRGLPDALTLQNVSALYRHATLAKLLHVKVPLLPHVLALFRDPFKGAWHTLNLLDAWAVMEESGFGFRELDYVISGNDDAVRPLAPAQKQVLLISKTLYDGMTAIDREHPDLELKEQATSDLLRSKLSVLFETAVVEQVVGLLDGTTVYTTNAPAGLTVTVPESLAVRLRYKDQQDSGPPQASLQIVGLLSVTEKAAAKALSSHPEWPKAIERAGKQAQNFYADVLFGIFSDPAAAKAALLSGDFYNPSDPEDPANTAPSKRFFLLQAFLPFLRQRLARRLIVDTLSGAASLANDVTGYLLSEVLRVGAAAEPAMSAIEGIKIPLSGAPAGWAGYLIPPSDDAYTFVTIGDTQPAPLILEGSAVPFPYQQEDPSNVWSSDPVKLKSGSLYALEVNDRDAAQLEWKTASSPRARVPGAALLPDHSSLTTAEVLTKLRKAAILVNGFALSVDEVSHLQSHSTDFASLDFNAITLAHWQRLAAYASLRNGLPRTPTSLLDLFRWAHSPLDATQLSDKIAAVTGWRKSSVDQLIAAEHFDLNRPDAFLNEVNLLELRGATIVADKVGVGADRLFEWAKPGSKFWACHRIAKDIENALRARFDQEDWEQVVKPLNDTLREHQKCALIDYLLVQPELVDWGVIDADSLFEFFLIDVQMDTCMETSRIKQAISSVQLFVQRCMLGEEEKHGVPNDVLDRDRWTKWMQNYRVWEANRKVFLYPENWLLPELRDDKSQFYKELESEILQKDINTENVTEALKSYLFKVDEIANLMVVGLFLDKGGNKLHIFSRTRNAPYFFHYRYFHTSEKNWYPWEKVQVDIPSYDVESGGKTKGNGAYLVPVVWNHRLFIFFPQILKKTMMDSPARIATKKTADGYEIPTKEPKQCWEIKLAWSDYRNGKWSQKQVSAAAVYDDASSDVAGYKLIPRVVTTPTDSKAVVDVYRDSGGDGVLVDSFEFLGSQAVPAGASGATLQTTATDFHYSRTAGLPAPRIHQLNGSASFNQEPYFHEQTTSVVAHVNGTAQRFSSSISDAVLAKLAGGGLDALFAYYSTEGADKDDAFGGTLAADGKKSYHELKAPYALYTWEAAYHALSLLQAQALKARQFELALELSHYVLNPYAPGDPTDPKRFWQFLPFREIDAESVLEKLFLGLQAGQANPEISEWRDKPFQPHVVARGRPTAYMKRSAMTQLQILIEWADHLFRRDTIESINQATQLYVLASHTCGPRAQSIPKRGKVVPQSYRSLLDKWDAFGNAMVELELAFPFSNQTPFPLGVSNGVVGLANVFGFASTLYFCIPDNPELAALRDTIDDRLFKIRHCENIEGVFRKLPLFEPPIDPALLVRAAAAGLSLSSVLSDVSSPMPNYRFYYLLQKAHELCSEVKSLGSGFLTAKEKGEAEGLARIRAAHETSLQTLIMEVKKLQLEEAQRSVAALEQSRKAPVYRLQHQLELIGEDLEKVPGANSDFAELPNAIEPPIDEGGLKLSAYEKEEMDKAAEANVLQEDVGRMETLAAILHIIPDLSVDTMPVGLGVTTKVLHGLGNAAQAVAKANQVVVGNRTFSSTNAGRKAGFLRQLQERVKEANSAGYEIKNIDKQILTQKIRIQIAEQDITNQQKLQDNAQEVEEFLRNKYTNQELYRWMEGQLRALYYQAYTLAYDLAKRAEKVFCFERGLTTSNVIQLGYWEPGYDGFLAGERLHIGLKQLEAAYQEKRGYDFELVKNVSLQQLHPLALLQLRETGRCEFALPEVLFDMGYPGHYMRRIKSVAVTLACHVGPPTSMNCVLRLLEHKFRTSARVAGKGDYAEHTDESDPRFSTINVPITSIAVSTGQNDSGLFELNFRDERYLPFEGAGVISRWRMELPESFREFDYQSITDVVMHLRYTALDGGDKLKAAAAVSVLSYVKSVEELGRDEGLFAIFDLRNDFPNEWYKATQVPPTASERVFALPDLLARLPFFTRQTSAAKILASDIYVFTPDDLSASELMLGQGGDDYAFVAGPAKGTLKSFSCKDAGVGLADWQLKVADVSASLEALWLVIRYTLG